jgi:transketolase
MTTTQTAAATREALGPTLVRLQEQGLDIVVVDADLGVSTTAREFGKKYPDRFFPLGIAEQNMISIAAGLAAAGKVVFASTFAVFMPGRCYDQIRMSVAQPHLNVKLVASHGGFTTGEDGASAQAIEDLALMCATPGMNVIVPADVVEARQAIEVAARTDGPFYIRTGRPKVPVVHDESYRFRLGRGHEARPGRDLTILANGVMVAQALQAADLLAGRGIDARVINMATLRPFDADTVERAARETGAILTVEEHQAHGALSSLAAQAAAERCPVPMRFMGLNHYGESGKWDELLEHFGFAPEHIATAARELVAARR